MNYSNVVYFLKIKVLRMDTNPPNASKIQVRTLKGHLRILVSHEELSARKYSLGIFLTF